MVTDRPRRPPKAVRAHLPHRERALASALLTDGTWAVVTARGLLTVGVDGVRWHRPWHEVDRGSWDEAEPAIAVRWVDGAETELRFVEPVPRSFPEAFRERVQSSVVHVERLDQPGGVTVRAVIRRADDGSLLSQVIADGAVGRSAVDRDAVLALEASARRAVGLPG